MKKSQALTLSERKYTYNILDSLEVELVVTENFFHLPIEELFTMAARINKKRSFLFVSKVLGKHIPIIPNRGLLVSALLAARYIESVKCMECGEKEQLLSAFKEESPLFENHPFISNQISPIIIGFAETATALGHAFFDCFLDADYFHTTREELVNQMPEITFEEEHSHATAHRCYIPSRMLQNTREIILVDDEITTGKTALNIIQSIHSKFPRSEYTVVSILDWRSEDNKQAFALLEKKLGITIHVVSLIAGNVLVKQLKKIENPIRNNLFKSFETSVETISLSSFSNDNTYPYISETGRFGIKTDVNQKSQSKISEAASFLKQKRIGNKTLCLGTGEFMYIPMKIAAEMGNGVYYQSTTRSPIYTENVNGYGARFGVDFINPECQAISYFVYNIPLAYYDEIFVFIERQVSFESLNPMLKELQQLHPRTIKIVFFSERRES